jgi:hypothetical protein
MDSFQKRNRERKKLEKRKAKQAKRLDRSGAKSADAGQSEPAEVDPMDVPHDPASEPPQGDLPRDP